MVSRTAAEDAVRNEVKGPERGDLIFFLGEQTDVQLSKWRILDADGDAAIVAFVRRKAQAAAAGQGVGSAAGAGGGAGGAALATGVAAGPGPGSAAMAGGEGILPPHKAREKAVERFFICDKKYSSMFTPVFPKLLVTHFHGEHTCWQPGYTLEVLVNDGTADRQRSVQAKVFSLHPNLDVVILTVEEDLEAPELDIGVAAEAPYMLLGCSNRSQLKPFSVSHGIISTTVPDAHGFIRGDSQSLAGESGGGCFSSENSKLFAMNVASDTQHGNRAVLVSVAALLALLMEARAPVPEIAWGEGASVS